HGELLLDTDGSFSYTPDTNFYGTDEFTYRASDLATSSAPATVTITVTPDNDAPVALADAYTVEEGNLLVVPIGTGTLANDSDVDGDVLTAVLATDTVHGELLPNPDGSFSYTPDAYFNGTDEFTYRASDGSLLSGVATVTITVTSVNDAPVALADAYTVDEDVVLSVPLGTGLLANDRDADLDSLTAVLASDTVHGELLLDTDGSFSYTPDTNFYGTDEFTYRASDGSLLSGVATVTITVTSVNDAPVALVDAYTVDEDVVLSVPLGTGVLANDSDIEGDALTAVLATDTAHGELLLDTDGSFSYTPDTNFYGTDEFTYRASDLTTSSAPATVTITVTQVDEPPVIALSGPTRFDTAVAISLAAYPLKLPADGERTVVIATGRNWPDALGGTALAGVLDGPILLVDTASIPSSVVNEIERLGAERAIILGGTSAVGVQVEQALAAQFGDADAVKRIAGSNRYETAERIAAAVIAAQPDYDGTAFVATGGTFPDALGAAPLAASQGWPLYLSHPVTGLSRSTKAAMAPVERVLVLGSTSAVSTRDYDFLYGAFNGAVERLDGINRYETAVTVATWGVEHAYLGWNRVGIATGVDFPDALAGGVLQGSVGSVMLLTRPTALDGYAASALAAHNAEITTVTYFGGTNVLSSALRDSVESLVIP
ncbi:MAG: tandem-95 repeat protein, partial [Coriobacteriia bacterium]